MMQLVMGIVVGVLGDGVITYGIFRYASKNNQKLVDSAVKEFEQVIEDKTKDILNVAMKQLGEGH